MKRRYERGGNKGFSLVELLVGVTILAVIITPLLSSLIASSKTAQKAREVRNATLAASNVIETFEAKPLKQLLTEITSGGISGLGTHAALCQYDAENDAYAELGDPSAVKEGEDVYYIALRGISSSKDTFDALVKLDATKYSINQEPVTTYTDMDVVFSQPYAEEENPDALALASLANQATVLARRSVAASELSGKIIRNLTITVSLDPEDATTFTAKARYAYTRRSKRSWNTTFSGETFQSLRRFISSFIRTTERRALTATTLRLKTPTISRLSWFWRNSAQRAFRRRSFWQENSATAAL